MNNCKPIFATLYIFQESNGKCLRPMLETKVKNKWIFCVILGLKGQINPLANNSFIWFVYTLNDSLEWKIFSSKKMYFILANIFYFKILIFIIVVLYETIKSYSNSRVNWTVFVPISLLFN